MFGLKVRSSAEVTVAEFLTAWVTTRPLDDNTRSRYAKDVRRHLIPHLGQIRLAGLRPTHIEDMYQAIAERNQRIRDTAGPGATPAQWRKDGHLAATTIASILRTLSVALNHAIANTG